MIEPWAYGKTKSHHSLGLGEQLLLKWFDTSGNVGWMLSIAFKKCWRKDLVKSVLHWAQIGYVHVILKKKKKWKWKKKNERKNIGQSLWKCK